jgi:hypothetical protein
MVRDEEKHHLLFPKPSALSAPQLHVYFSMCFNLPAQEAKLTSVNSSASIRAPCIIPTPLPIRYGGGSRYFGDKGARGYFEDGPWATTADVNITNDNYCAKARGKDGPWRALSKLKPSYGRVALVATVGSCPSLLSTYTHSD